jgi:hypothetical protein
MKKLPNKTKNHKKSSSKRSISGGRLVSVSPMKVVKGLWGTSLITLVAFTALFALLPVKHADSLTPKTALIYGDSLTYESSWAISQQFATKNGWTHAVRSFPSTAPCDWLSWLTNDLATYQPSVVSLSTAGGAYTACMKDTNGNQMVPGSQAYYDKYSSDLAQFFSQVTATGAKVVFMKAPPMLDAAANERMNQISNIATQLAGQYHGVSISSVPRNAVSNSGKYTQTKPCLASETAALGCQPDGKIAIRNTDGLHFCPTTYTTSSSYPFWWCSSSYSSGAYRWGRAIANTTANPPAPVLP